MSVFHPHRLPSLPLISPSVCPHHRLSKGGSQKHPINQARRSHPANATMSSTPPHPTLNLSSPLPPQPFTTPTTPLTPITGLLSSPTTNIQNVLDCSADSKRFSIVQIHTAKCAICDARNMAVMRRCPGCTYQVCQPCFSNRNSTTLLHGNLATMSSGGSSLPSTPVRRSLLFNAGTGSANATSSTNYAALTTSCPEPASVAGQASGDVAGVGEKGTGVVEKKSGDGPRAKKNSDTHAPAGHEAREQNLPPTPTPAPKSLKRRLEPRAEQAAPLAPTSTAASTVKTSKRGRVLRGKAPIIDIDSDEIDNDDEFLAAMDLSPSPVPAPKRRRTSGVKEKVQENAAEVAPAGAASPTPKTRRPSKGKAAAITKAMASSTTKPTAASSSKAGPSNKVPAAAPITDPTASECESPAETPTERQFRPDRKKSLVEMIDDFFESQGVPGYPPGGHLLGRQVPYISNPVINVPSPVRRNFIPRPRAEEMRKVLAEKVDKKLKERWAAAEAAGVLDKLRDAEPTDAIPRHLQSVRDLTSTIGLRQIREASVTMAKEQEEEFFYGLRDAAYKMLVKFREETAPAVLLFLTFALDMLLEDLGKRQLEEITQAIEAGGVRFIKDIEAKVNPFAAGNTAALGSTSLASPGSGPVMGIFQVSPTKRRFTGYRELSPRNSPARETNREMRWPSEAPSA
ncbi:hypothetical protein BCR34DRAFT_68010 [Clohesyomyces aquaticus]|uniref:Uncharacterized protein n=1 Tax=Clohesyomyces aquaticus TaxID=1231657 RepID=A0A1Y1Z0D0_9PLEO|nr:hypothetical protein BCR34DRAFT_68010 [Clohesyomyces aquaticus]